MRLFFQLMFVALTTTLLVCGSSCNLLDQTSPNNLDAETAINTPTAAQNALIGIYSSLQRENYYGGTFPLTVDALGQNAATGGFDNPLLDEIGAQSVTAANGAINDLWITMYFTIANCNRLLEALPALQMDAAQKSSLEGQALGLRALAHFDVLRLFGYHWDTASPYGIPIVNRSQTISDKTGRATVAAVYDFIITDLNKALTLLNPDDRATQFFNSLTAKALLARVYLYKKDMPMAAAFATEVIDDGAYRLLPATEFATIYTSRYTPESIFELAFDNQNRSAYNALTYSRPDALRTEINFLSHSSLKMLFDEQPDDVRATMHDFSTDTNDESITSDGSGRTQKYRGEVSKDNSAYILRLAEMYLIRAEATNSLTDLNTLREARGVAPLAVAPENFVEAVLRERKAELNFEGHIFFDLARTGRYTDITPDEFRAAMPIPLREITATDGALTQNPGY